MNEPPVRSVEKAPSKASGLEWGLSRTLRRIAIGQAADFKTLLATGWHFNSPVAWVV